MVIILYRKLLNMRTLLGEQQEKPARILGIKPLNLFMKRNKNIFFRGGGTRKNTSFLRAELGEAPQGRVRLRVVIATENPLCLGD